MLLRRKVSIFQTRGFLGGDPNPEAWAAMLLVFGPGSVFTPDPGHYCTANYSGVGV